MKSSDDVASADQPNDLNDRVLDAWRDRLRDGEWRTRQELLESIPMKLCDDHLKSISELVYCDLKDPHEISRAAFAEQVLPRLMADDAFEHQGFNGKQQIRQPVFPLRR